MKFPNKCELKSIVLTMQDGTKISFTQFFSATITMDSEPAQLRGLDIQARYGYRLTRKKKR